MREWWWWWCGGRWPTSLRATTTATISTTPTTVLWLRWVDGDLFSQARSRRSTFHSIPFHSIPFHYTGTLETLRFANNAIGNDGVDALAGALLRNEVTSASVEGFGAVTPP